jgi:hypothetical protein
VRQATPENVNSLLQGNLDNALQGDMDSAYFVIRTRMACERFAGSPEELERRIQRINQRVDRDLERGRDLPVRPSNPLPVLITPDAEVNRVEMEQWYEACQRVQAAFTPDLRQRLEAQALRGDVMARLIYATWPLEKLDFGSAFDQQYHWERNARDFSQANLDRGELAGLIAFAQSYQYGWFTPRNGDLALAFTMAAFNCGFENDSMRNFLLNRINQLTSSDDPADLQRLEFALLEAQSLGSICGG